LIKKYCFLCMTALVLLVAGCASVTTQPPATAAIPEVTPLGATPSQSAEGVIQETQPRPVEPFQSGNKAVIALVDRARFDTGAGKREAAGSSLERALRIEPRNAWLWHELAQLRVTQGQYAQAISLAQKSNSFAGRERRLQALNWRVIGSARVAQGDPAGAEQAFKLATELEQ
jgi:predicted Zn-dependent protease